MNVDTLLHQYFADSGNICIEMFDEKNIQQVYRRLVEVLIHQPEVETSLLQAMSYCFYEVMDNVLIHSGKTNGIVITNYSEAQHLIQILVADDGMGIQSSLSQNQDYASITEPEALEYCIRDRVSDGKGMGFGLYTTSRLVDSIGKELILHSGSHKLMIKDDQTSVIENGFWQGTLIYMKIGTSEEIDPNQIVDHRTDVTEEYNETFVETGELDSLW